MKRGNSNLQFRHLSRLRLAWASSVLLVLFPFSMAGASVVSADTVNVSTIQWADGSTSTTASNNAGSVLPAGVILALATSNVPSGFFECNGSTVSRSAYGNLFASIGTSWGSGDGSTTFNLPDLRGVFLRGWNHGAADGYDDPDSSSRAARLSGGASGNNVGSFQTDELKSHTHSYNGANGSGAFFSQVSAVIAVNSLTSGATGGNETRPRNAYVTYIIKY